MFSFEQKFPFFRIVIPFSRPLSFPSLALSS